MTGVTLTSIATFTAVFVLTVLVVYVLMGIQIHNISSAIKTRDQCEKLEASEKIIEETDKQVKKFKSAVSLAGACVMRDKCG